MNNNETKNMGDVPVVNSADGKRVVLTDASGNLSSIGQENFVVEKAKAIQALSIRPTTIGELRAKMVEFSKIYTTGASFRCGCGYQVLSHINDDSYPVPTGSNATTFTLISSRGDVGHHSLFRVVCNPFPQYFWHVLIHPNGAWTVYQYNGTEVTQS